MHTTEYLLILMNDELNAPNVKMFF